jgi:hypothetical protein
MAVTSSEPISITDLVTEFGGDAPHSLTEYYRGGSLVPNNSNNQLVPTSGNPISLTNFYGATNTITTDNYTIEIASRNIGFFLAYGFSSTASGFPFGAISANTIGFDGLNVTIEGVYWTANSIFFRASTNPGDSGWTSMTVGSTVFNRTDATYGGGNSINTWSWTSSNVMGTSGTQTVSWTE